MATQLVSPGVSVSVTDESTYAAPGTGTIPLVLLATRENKVDPTGTYPDGIALYTKPQLAGRMVPVTSQRELTQFFGTPYITKSGANVVEGAQTTEYGLLAAYSYLGQGGAAFVMRADVDLGELDSREEPPVGPVVANTLWIDPVNSSFGVHEWNATEARWVPQTVLVGSSFLSSPSTRVDATDSDEADAAPIGTYLVDVTYLGATGTTVTGLNILYYRKSGEDVWELVDVAEPFDGQDTQFAPHYQAPALRSDTTALETGDIWINTTRPGNGINLKMYISDANGVFAETVIQGVSDEYESTDFIPQDGSSLTVLTPTNGRFQIYVDADGSSTVSVYYTVDGVPDVISAVAPGVSNAVYTIAVQTDEPVGEPVEGTVWYYNDPLGIDVLYRAAAGWTRLTADPTSVSPMLIKSFTEPTSRPNGGARVNGDIWLNTSVTGKDYPALYTYVSGSNRWIKHTNTDQTTSRGVLFAEITTQTAEGVVTANITPTVQYQLYPQGMLAVNMNTSANTVRQYVDGVWRNAARNHADGRGSFGYYAQKRFIADAMQAALNSSQEAQEPAYAFNLLCAPGFPELTGELQNLNTNRGETGFIIVDTPMGLAPNEVVGWINSTTAAEDGEDGLNSSGTYMAVYYPSVRASAPTGETLTVPASHAVLYQYAYNDNVAYPWFAPAGLTRGVVQNAEGVGYIDREGEFRPVSLNNAQRDALYLNKVNPIANFPADGIVVFGNKTLHSTTSALDRVNVARLVNYLKERFEQLGRPFLFEPNDVLTRDRVRFVYEGFLADMISKRAITDFIVQCDETNNTPARIDRNELYVDIAIVPTKSVEFIYIPIRLVNTGAI